MCDVIGPEFVLANLLMHGHRSVSIHRLKELRRKIENQIPSVFVDVTTDSLCATIECRSDMFQWVSEDKIERAPKATRFFSTRYVNASINWRVPDRIRTDCLSILAGRASSTHQHASP